MTASMFEDWCNLLGRRPLPAPPTLVAQYVAETGPLGIEEVWKAVQEVSLAHCAAGFADPTLGGAVAAAINEISKIEPPRSWPKEMKGRFATLPYDLQLYVSDRVKEQERVTRTAIQMASEARREAGLPKLPKGYYREIGKGDSVVA